MSTNESRLSKFSKRSEVELDLTELTLESVLKNCLEVPTIRKTQQ